MRSRTWDELNVCIIVNEWDLDDKSYKKAKNMKYIKLENEINLTTRTKEK